MELSAGALWLNTVFEGFDYAILQALHSLAQGAGGLLTPFFTFVTLIGEQGFLMFLLAVILMAFKNTRKVGLCIFVAVCIGAFATSFVLKDVVARPRPFEASELYYAWWQFVGSPAEDGFSFPSGHVTAATAGVIALIIASKKPLTWVAVLYPITMAISRPYLVSHYPTDVLAAALIGILAAALAYLLVSQALKLAYRKQIGWVEKIFPSPDALATQAPELRGKHVKKA